jgi:Spy/CpxP family protein refolding chaperone
MKKTLLALMLTAIFAVPAFAQMDDMGKKGHKEGHGPQMEMCHMDKMGEMMGSCLKHADKLGLSEDQLTQLKVIHRAMEKNQARFQADLKIAQIDQMEIMDVKDFDLEKASAGVQKISDLQKTYHLEMLKSMKAAHAILTDEQFKKMKKMMAMTMDGNRPKPAKRHK